jgi:hypothetical protein
MSNGVLAKMLERLFAALVNGPSLNCRPHASRQRIDLVQLGKLKDVAAEEVLRSLLGEDRLSRAVAKVQTPKRPKPQNRSGSAKHNGDSDTDLAPELSPEEKAAIAAWEDQELVFKKLRVIVDDARTYEQDTGVHVLSIGFPLLTLPPNSFKAGGGSLTRRIVAPVAFLPVTVTVKQGTGRSVEIKCRGEGADLVSPNTALLAWLQQQAGQMTSDLFADEKGEAPWREIRELTALVAKLAGVKPPDFLAAPEDAPDGEPAHLPLVSAPRTDDDAQGAIIPAAVLGLFPMANQGLLRDMQEMTGDEPLNGPVASFIKHDTILDAPPTQPDPDQPQPASKRTRDFSHERLITAADPSQSRAVRLARDCQGLVVHGPPGTGKSQTITNIIGDHLWRGQRVLVVCDKRTALDVVIDRLDRLGLRKLCALVYDPQRDRRELYKNIRQQLDDLPDVRTDDRAEREVDRLDSELQCVHEELTRYTSALSGTDPKTGLSFHEMVGQWLAASAIDLPKINPKLLDAISLESLQKHEQDVLDVLDRATEADYPRNSWREAWAPPLSEYLARPMAEVRECMGNTVTAAQDVDATAHPTIPSFDPELPLPAQADKRTTLAGGLRGLLQTVNSHLLSTLSARHDLSKAASTVETDLRHAQTKLDETEPLLKLFRAKPLDAELLTKSREHLPSVSVAAESLRVVRAFTDAYRTWSGRYRFIAAAASSASPEAITHWLSQDAAALSRARQNLTAMHPIADAISSTRLDRSLWLQFQRRPFDIAQTVRWLGMLNAYLDTATKWYAFLKPGPRKAAAPIAYFFGLALMPETATQLRDFLTALRARLELKADLEDGILPRPLPQFPGDEELLTAYSQTASIVAATVTGQSVSGTFIAPEVITPLMSGQTAAAEPVFSGYGLAVNEPAGERLAEFLSGLWARLRVVEILNQLSIATELPLPQDSTVEKMIADVSRALNFLLKVNGSPELNSVRQQVSLAMHDAATAPPFLEGLDRSAARATAILKLEQSLMDTKLLRETWRAATDARLRKGSLESPGVQSLHDHLDSLEAVLRVAKGLAALPDALRDATNALVAESADREIGLAALRRSALSAEITARLKADPELQDVDRQRMKSGFDRYRSLDTQKRQAVRDATLHRWVSRQKERLLAATGSRLNTLGAELRRRLTITGERAVRLRQVIALGRQIPDGDPLFDLCPVWMASPETVAQLFPREPIFDVVIFDEASQCRLEEALPVLTRAKRVVIAGDPQQLPPTRFFESAIVESDNEEIESDQQLFETRQGEIEDLLAAALNLEIQQSYLDVHYRSRNSDLIQFSNEHFYKSRLQPIPAHPSNRARFAPVTLYRSDGVYEKRSNDVEAEQVCTIVADLLKRSEPPSIGIACFNLPQRDLIVEKLDDMALEDPAFGKRLAAARSRQGSGSSEGLFVKNLENVQGDERDHIIISTTYGPDPAGKFHRRFGPVGRIGGGRRLNVLITRARHEVHLVTSIPTNAYRTLPPIPTGQAPSGTWLLFSYLAYAEQLTELYDHQPQDGSEPAALLPAMVNVHPTRTPSVFSHALANDLARRRKTGSDVHWGNDGFCIDLALHHPTRPEDVTIGVLCDGSRFALAEDLVEWDVFRTGVLEGQGWTLHRIWTPHFFRDPQGTAKAIGREVQDFLSTDPQADVHCGTK